MENYRMNQIATEFQTRLDTARKKAQKIMFIVTFVSFALTILFWYLQSIYEGAQPAFFIFVVVSIICALILILILKAFVSEKPLFEYLMPIIIEDINLSGEATLTYEAYPNDKAFFDNVGIFHHYASKYLRFRIQYLSQNHFSATIYDAYVYVSNGKSTTTLLDGLYYCFESQTSQAFQLRSWGRPGLKEIKWKKNETPKPLKEFVDESIQKPLEPRYYEIYDWLRISNPKGIQYIGGYRNQFDVAISRPLRIKKVKNVNSENYQLLRKSILENCEMAEKIYSLLSKE